MMVFLLCVISIILIGYHIGVRMKWIEPMEQDEKWLFGIGFSLIAIIILTLSICSYAGCNMGTNGCVMYEGYVDSIEYDALGTASCVKWKDGSITTLGGMCGITPSTCNTNKRCRLVRYSMSYRLEEVNNGR